MFCVMEPHSHSFTDSKREVQEILHYLDNSHQSLVSSSVNITVVVCILCAFGNTQLNLTFLLVEDQLSLELPPVIQSSLDLSCEPITGFRAVQEVAGAAFLHELCPGVAGELAESIGAVDDGVERLHLGVSQNKVAVCGTEEIKEGSIISVKRKSLN